MNKQFPYKTNIDRVITDAEGNPISSGNPLPVSIEDGNGDGNAGGGTQKTLDEIDARLEKIEKAFDNGVGNMQLTGSKDKNGLLVREDRQRLFHIDELSGTEIPAGTSIRSVSTDKFASFREIAVVCVFIGKVQAKMKIQNELANLFMNKSRAENSADNKRNRLAVNRHEILGELFIRIENTSNEKIKTNNVEVHGFD